MTLKGIITKEMLIKAFQMKNRKRFTKLYIFYSDSGVFSSDLTAIEIAEYISKDIGIKITEKQIYEINRRVRIRQQENQLLQAQSTIKNNASKIEDNEDAVNTSDVSTRLLQMAEEKRKQAIEKATRNNNESLFN